MANIQVVYGQTAIHLYDKKSDLVVGNFRGSIACSATADAEAPQCRAIEKSWQETIEKN